MQEVNKRITDILSKKKAEGSYRTLADNHHLIDFCSNDYLGLSRSEALKLAFFEELHKLTHPLGATGSRLISGNDAYTEFTENQIAAFHQADAALLFNSGYDANLGLFSSLLQREDTILYDELAHASIIDGIRLSKASAVKFWHNDFNDLRAKLEHSLQPVFIAVESIYSMDGDLAPLRAIAALAKEYDAALIVDEAHSTGLYGPNGEGLVVEQQLTSQVFARIVTFGKAFGTHGAAVLGSRELRSYLINHARSFIFSTAASPASIAAIRCSYDLIKDSDQRIKLQENIKHFQQSVENIPGFIKSNTAIQGLIVPGNANVLKAASHVQQKGFDVRAIRSPSVARGKERLRICLHSFNTKEEITNLIDVIKQFLHE